LLVVVRVFMGSREYAAEETSSIEFVVFKDTAVATPVDLRIQPLSFDQYLAIPEGTRPHLEQGTELPLAPSFFTPIQATR